MEFKTKTVGSRCVINNTEVQKKKKDVSDQQDKMEISQKISKDSTALGILIGTFIYFDSLFQYVFNFWDFYHYKMQRIVNDNK